MSTIALIQPFIPYAPLLLILFPIYALLSRLFFSPLAQFPAIHPLAHITSLPFILLSFTRRRYLHLYNLHITRSIPILRLTPTHLSFSSTTAIKDIYSHSTPCVKDEFYRHLAGEYRHLADVQDRGDHSRKRRILSAAYAASNVVRWEWKIQEKAERLVAVLDKSQGKEIDWRSLSNLLTLELIFSIGLSEDVGFLLSGTDEVDAAGEGKPVYKARVRQSLHGGVRNQSVFVWAREWYPLVKKITKLVPKWRNQWLDNVRWNDIVHHATKKRLHRYENGERLGDFFDVLMEDRGGVARKLDFGETEAEVSIMLNAGSDTTAIALTNLINFILTNPSVLAKLRKELATVLTPEDIPMPYTKLQALPYLRAVVLESLRLYPPTSFSVPRMTPPAGAVIDGHFLPGNTTVSVSAYVAHRNPDIYPSPNEFIPERWLGEEGKDAQRYFIAFSMGARGCIGRNLSMMEQMVVGATVAWGFDGEVVEKEVRREEGFNCWVKELKCRFKRREVW